MRKALVVSVALAVCTLAGAGVAGADGATHSSFAGTFGGTNPCTGEVVALEGSVKIVYREGTNSAGGTHVGVHLRFRASGTGDHDNAYRAKWVANEHFDQVAASYEVQAHGVVVGKGATPNFHTTGTIEVSVVDGEVTGASFTSLTPTCV